MRCHGFSLAVVLTIGLSAGEPSAKKPDLSPASWPEAERKAAVAYDWEMAHPPHLAEGKSAMAATTSFGGISARVGLDALRQGGSAMDAALAMALVQTTLNLGSWTSFAGIANLVVYEAKTGEVHTLNGCWQTLLEESDPESVPAEEPSGRAALVPGFMAAVQAAHDRFGKLPFDQLFAPAIYFAEEGFELHPMHAWLIDNRKRWITRLPAGRDLFAKSDGALYAAGDHFRQPLLAKTLRGVAAEGAAYMYRGAWAEKFVEAVHAEGGKLTMADLRAYEPTWGKPLRGRFRDYEIAAMDAPNQAGLHLIEAFRLAERANLKQYGHYSENAEALYRLMQISRVGTLLTWTGGRKGFDGAALFGDLDTSRAARLKPETSAKLWEMMAADDWAAKRRAAFGLPETGGHSDAVIVMDAEGNLVAMTHSINTVLWGSTGIFVDGVSIPDPAAIQQKVIARTGPGQRVPEFMDPAIVLRDGKPAAASSAIGRSLNEETLQNLLNMLEYGMDPKASLDRPRFLGPDFGDKDAYHRQRVFEGDFSESILDGVRALGQPVVLQKKGSLRGIGYWVGLRIDPDSGKIQAATTPQTNGRAQGF